MADVVGSVQDFDKDGADLTETNAPTSPDDFQFANNDKRTFVMVNNGSGSEITVTIESPATIDGEAITDKTVDIAANTIALIGPFKQSIYNDGSDRVHLVFSASTSVTVAAVRMDQI